MAQFSLPSQRRSGYRTESQTRDSRWKGLGDPAVGEGTEAPQAEWLPGSRGPAKTPSACHGPLAEEDVIE